MRIKTVDTNEYEWHDWFAWYPCWVSTGPLKGTWVFWERVQRRYQTTYDGVTTYIRNLDGTPLE